MKVQQGNEAILCEAKRVILREAAGRRIHLGGCTMTKLAFVYILASKKNGTLYTGVTSDLERRMYQHKHHLLEGFTSKYEVTRLVWYAQGDDIGSAISFEKKIKNRNRQWKINLIEKTNPGWVDLAADWMDSGSCDSAQDDGLEYAQGDGAHPVIPRAVAESMGGKDRPCDCAQGDGDYVRGDGDYAQGDGEHPVIPRAVAESIAQGDTPRSARNDDGERV